MTTTLWAVATLLVAVCCASPNPAYWRSPAGLKRLCKLTGYGCPAPSTTRVLKAFHARHGQVDASTLEPVVLVPGIIGSGLQAEIDKNYKVAWECFKKWRTPWGIWVNLYEALAQTCWFDNLLIRYNETSDSFHNNPGVTIKPNDFGGLNGIDKLDHFDDPFDLTAYYLPLIKTLRGAGYVPGVNLFGAPYDWRLSVDALMASTNLLGTNNTFEVDLRLLIERAFNTSGGRRVHIVTHSMGGPTLLYFLNRRSLAWKDKYVASFVPIAGPFAGALKALRAMVSGDNMGLEIPLVKWSLLSEDDIARNFRQSGSASYIAPDYDYYGDQVFITTPTRNYTAADFGQMFTDIGAPVSAALWAKKKDLVSDLVHPQVTSYCLYGWNVATEIHLTYPKGFPTDPNTTHQPIIDFSDLGDGTVPLFSLIECKNWINKEHTSHQVNCREYKLIDHTAILKDEALHLDLLEIVTGRSDIVGCEDTAEFTRAVAERQKYMKR